MAASSPTGTAKTAARKTSRALPAMAFAMPPPVWPTGAGSRVKKARLRAVTPWTTPAGLADLPDQHPGQGVDHDRHQQEDQAQFDQGRQVQVVSGFRKLVGD